MATDRDKVKSGQVDDEEVQLQPLPAPPVHEPASDEIAEKEEGDLESGKKAPSVEMIDGRPRDIYDRFTKRQKTMITCIVSYSAFIAPVTSSVFLPSIPIMASDLHTTASTINYTVAIFIVTIGVAPLFWSPFAGFYGRKGVYLSSMPIMVAASIGVAQCKNVGGIIGTRILQGIGSSAVLAVGAGSIGDVFRPTERANAMGWFYSGALMGPAFSPLIAGLFTQYTALTWRSTQYWLAGCGALSVFLTFFFLPETSHPPTPHQVLKAERGKKFVWYRFNPLSILKLFAWPNICCITFVSSCTMLETYCFLVPLATVFREQYGILNVALSGLLYVAAGGGNFIGARIGGPWADRVVKKYIAKRGYRRPEDRLRGAVIACGVALPLSCLGYGWLIEYSAGGVGPPILMMIISGIALLLVLTPVNTYAVDVMQKRSAEVIAVNNFVRYLFAAAASAFILPMAQAIGWGWTMTIAAVIAWMACGALLLAIRFGEKWRLAADRRYGPPGATATDTIAPVMSTKEDKEAVVEDSHSHHEREEEHHGQHTELVPRPARPRTRTIIAGSGQAPIPLSRQSSVKSMPPVGEVLKRTVSLSGVSVHGGG